MVMLFVKWQNAPKAKTVFNAISFWDKFFPSGKFTLLESVWNLKSFDTHNDLHNSRQKTYLVRLLSFHIGTSKTEKRLPLRKYIGLLALWIVFWSGWCSYAVHSALLCRVGCVYCITGRQPGQGIGLRSIKRGERPCTHTPCIYERAPSLSSVQSEPRFLFSGGSHVPGE